MKRIKAMFKNTTSNSAKIMPKLYSIFQKKETVPLKCDQLNKNIQLLSYVSSPETVFYLREEIDTGTQSEINARLEAQYLSRFYANNVYLPCEESKNTSKDLPPSYEQLFGDKAKELNIPDNFVKLTQPREAFKNDLN